MYRWKEGWLCWTAVLLLKEKKLCCVEINPILTRAKTLNPHVLPWWESPVQVQLVSLDLAHPVVCPLGVLRLFYLSCSLHMRNTCRKQVTCVMLLAYITGSLLCTSNRSRALDFKLKHCVIVLLS